MGAQFLTPEQYETLRQNGERQQAAKASGEWIDFPPVVKLFTPDAGATWLLTSLYPADTTIAFGLCDLGQGFPELGDVSLVELAQLCGPFGLPVERDCHFIAHKTILEYARDAYAAGRIVT